MGQYSNGVHVVYIPFKDCNSELEAVKNWNDLNGERGKFAGDNNYHTGTAPVKTKRNFIPITENNPQIPAHLNFSASAANVLYILGHCESGGFSLSASAGTILSESVSSTELAKRVSSLIGDSHFAGGIKIYACQSALGFLIRYSFAHYFAEELLTEYKYKSCTIYGYTAGVSNYESEYKNDKVGDITNFYKVSKTIQSKFVDFFSNERSLHTRAKDVRLKVAENGMLLGKK
jgi:hypothetical protein